ncbi:UNVERIFIED_CONTAM: LuxR family two component transcriptional regulator [Acetivibrio alkalicellulosi]
MIKVVIIEDDIHWQKGIVEILNKEDDISIVGVASNGEDALNLLNSLDVDVVLMDISLNGSSKNGIFITAEISDLYKTKIIMLTSYNSDDFIVKSFTAGASNYILKSDLKYIAQSIRETFNKCSPTEILAKKHIELRKELYLKSLTDAERHIYSLFESGYKLKDMENITQKSTNTIRNQIRSILSKLGAKSMKDSVKRKHLIKKKEGI